MNFFDQMRNVKRESTVNNVEIKSSLKVTKSGKPRKPRVSKKEKKNNMMNDNNEVK